MKGQRVHTGERHQHELDPEQQLAVIARRLAVEEQKSTERGDDEAHHLPWKQALLNFRNRRPNVSKPRQPQVHHDDQPEEQAHADDVRRQQDRVAVGRFAERDAG
jgi:hypothetical protein